MLGLDVSLTAIEKAKERNPGLNFDCRNILKDEFKEDNFDLVVLSEVLWYILDDLPTFFTRVSSMMSATGSLAIHQYFPADQRFGRELIEGLPGFLNFMEGRADLSRQHMYTSHHHDGVVFLSTFQKEE